MVKAMANEMDSLDQNGVRFIVLGNRDRLGPELNEEIDRCMKRTEDNQVLTLIIFLSYSGKWDILQAAKKMAMDMLSHPEDIEKMGLDDFGRYLVTDGIPDPDLIVRTSGENRLSNYLLWQCAYTEFYFCDTFWPDFNAEDLQLAINYYNRKERRFGKTSEQVTAQN